MLTLVFVPLCTSSAIRLARQSSQVAEVTNGINSSYFDSGQIAMGYSRAVTIGPDRQHPAEGLEPLVLVFPSMGSVCTMVHAKTTLEEAGLAV